jgi:hypothetical protein
MKKELAELEKEKHVDLENKILMHKKYNAKMKVIEVGIEETCTKSNDFYVYCKLKGKLGNVTETLEYVLKNYGIVSTSK